MHWQNITFIHCGSVGLARDDVVGMRINLITVDDDNGRFGPLKSPIEVELSISLIQCRSEFVLATLLDRCSPRGHKNHLCNHDDDEGPRPDSQAAARRQTFLAQLKAE